LHTLLEPYRTISHLLFTGSCVQKPQVSRPECYKEVRRSAYSNRGTEPSAQKVSFLSRMLQNILPFFIQQLCSDSKFLVENVTKQFSFFIHQTYGAPPSAQKVIFLFRTFRNSLPVFNMGLYHLFRMSRMLQNSLPFFIHQPRESTSCSESKFLVQNVTKHSAILLHIQLLGNSNICSDS
jgi:hypothetical protein